MYIIDIFYFRFLKTDGTGISIGGVETYIGELSQLAMSMHIGVRIFQYANKEFVKETSSAIIYGVCGKKKTFEKLYQKALSIRDERNTYLNIIASDILIPQWKVPNSIAIQHGIGFDNREGRSNSIPLSFLCRTFKAYRRIKRIQNVDEVVCVDNHFICWYRTQIPQRRMTLIPIMNFAPVGSERVSKSDDPIKIVFARRFVPIRGTRLFAPVAKRLLDNYGNNVDITFAGDGPDGSYLHNYFIGDKRVHFTQYEPSKSVEFHQQFNIAVVPSVYSEGTSLSLLEAMSAQCAVVCTNIGGMTNIILDQYNGIMISPSEEDLWEALSILIKDKSLRIRLSQNAYYTVKYSFSLEKWQLAWKKVLMDKFDKSE